MLFKKLKAGALQYTIFISVLIALLVTAFISLSFLHQKTRIKAQFFREAIHNSNLGFAYVGTHYLNYGESKEIQPSNIIANNVRISKKHWGLFDLVVSESQIKNDSFTKMALMGGQNKQRSALYLKDDSKPLILVGETEIRGTAMLPKKGVRRGNIGGHSYYGSQLIYGATRESNGTLPDFLNKSHVDQLVRGYVDANAMKRFELEENIELTNSFLSTTFIYEQHGPIDIRETKLIGNIIIRSTSKIKLLKTAQLEDVILIAPIIEIEDEVTGSFQAFATKRLTVGANCNLSYPTVLFLKENGKSNSQKASSNQQQLEHQIKINSASKVKGVVCFLSDNSERNYQPQILVEKNATIVGEVYCERNLDLKGTVKGSVYTANFVAAQFGSVYLNHVFNGAIIAPELPVQYSGLQFENNPQNIAKWVY